MGYRVLVIEDDAGVRRTLEHILRGGDHDVLAVPEGRQAIELARAADFDVVLCDLGLPDMDGAEVLRQLLAEHPAMGAVVLSGRPLYESMPRVEQATGKEATVEGGIAVLQKPMRPAEVLRVVVEAGDDAVTLGPLARETDWQERVQAKLAATVANLRRAQDAI